MIIIDNLTSKHKLLPRVQKCVIPIPDATELLQSLNYNKAKLRQWIPECLIPTPHATVLLQLLNGNQTKTATNNTEMRDHYSICDGFYTIVKGKQMQNCANEFQHALSLIQKPWYYCVNIIRNATKPSALISSTDAFKTP